MKIEVNVSDLQQTGRDLRQAEAQLESIQSSLRRAMGQLTLESRRRSDVDSTYQTINQQLQEIRQELEELSKLSQRKGEQFQEADGKGKPLISAGAWKFIGIAVSMALDFVPIVGNAKGLIEAVTGRDLVTGDKLALWERGVGILGPLGKGVSATAKLGKVATEAAGGIALVSKVTGVTDAVKSGERVVEGVTETAKATEKIGDAIGTGGKIADAAHDIKSADRVVEVVADGSKVSGGAKTGETITDGGVAAAGIAGAGGAAVAGGLSAAGKSANAGGDVASGVRQAENVVEAERKVGDFTIRSKPSQSNGGSVQQMNSAQRNSLSHVSDPIHAGTGHQFIKHPVMKLYGATTWELVLDYNSGLLQRSELGLAWTHNYALRLEWEKEEMGTITVWWNAGRRNRFIRQEDGSYRSRDIDVQGDILRQLESGYELELRSSRERYQFNSEGQLQAHVDPYGLILEAGYDEQEQLVSLTDSLTDRSFTLTYNEEGLLQSISDGSREVTLHYHEQGYLREYVNPTGISTEFVCDSEGRILQMLINGQLEFANTYDEQYRIIAQEDAEGRVNRLEYDTESQPWFTRTTLTNRLGEQRQFLHDENYLLLEVTEVDGSTQKFTYSETGLETSATNPLGETTQKLYDSNGQLISWTDPLGNTTSYRYDERYGLIEERDALGGVTSYRYDEHGRLAGITKPDGTSSKIQYNEHGQRISYQDFNGGVTKFEYGESGQLIAIEDGEGRLRTVSYDEAGRMNGVRDALDGKLRRIYDAKDNLTQVIDSLGRTWNYTYNENDQLLEVRMPSGAATRYTYTPSGQVETITDPLGNTKRYSYDAEDRLISEQDAAGAVTRFEYSEAGRISQIIDPLGRPVAYTYDAAGRQLTVTDAEGRTVLSLAYDAAGNPLGVTDGLGHTTRHRFNAMHQVVERTDAAGKVTEYRYDAAHRLQEVIEEDVARYTQSYDGENKLTSYTDANGNTTQLRYDRSGLLVEEANASGGSRRYTYDERGWMSGRSNARDQETTYQYDAAGQLLQAKDEVGRIQFGYDGDGRLISATEGEASTSRQYDAAGRLVESTDVWGHSIRYGYDVVGRLTQLTYPDGKVVEYRYNLAGELTEVRDWKGRVTRYTYDRNGRLQETLRPNGTREQREYDVAGQLTRLKDQSPQGIMLQQYRYVYNEIGQITQEEEKQYTYDKLRRLISGAWGGRKIQYSYDTGGNLTETRDSQQASPWRLSYGKDNRLSSVGLYPVELDADGNLLYYSDGEKMGAYEYDARNRLTRSGKASYRYDWKGERISLTYRGKTTRYVVDDATRLSRVLMELDETGEVKAYYIYGLGLIGREDAQGQYSSYHSDLRGSTTLLTNEQGMVTDRYTYGVYGELEQHEGTTSQPFQYNGRDGVMTDPNGLYYMRARYYHPGLKRFLNRDLIRGDIRDGQTFNRYAYVNGDPVKYVDPLGLCKEQTLPNMGERAAGDNIGSMLRGEGKGKIDDIAKKPFLPDEYYKNNYAPMQGTPGARIDFSRLGSSGQIEKSRVIYDQAGKQKYRIDYSDHGNSAHHTSPHMHEYIYQDAGKNVKSEIKYFMDFSTGRLRQGVIDEVTNTIKFID
ncbi:hypothetical protein DMN77_23300 [Paenibacillus sp. 79R4]|uniref:RHS repeat-associated core domain-containing protein n=1 Tax=Paenibacillus sp. 79R4 TaxID=2212847 RepID=UPI0015B83170|nr:RHS repeat-associated core domain-containing protein [Paenibacillus sp. 79R4]NWL90478.1 hypothetical protein [Paenibacillus sp. 79R4]